MTRRYGRAPRGQRVIGSVPHNYGKQLTVLAALDRHGIRAAMTVEGATDGPLFLTFLQRVLLWQLVWHEVPSGDFVVHWSDWRRRHQAQAQRCYYRRHRAG